MVTDGHDLMPGDVGRLVDWASAKLASSSESPRLDAELLIAAVAGIRRSAVLAFPEKAVAARDRERFADLVQRRASGEPLAYLTGTREFFSLSFAVGPDVLVPRPETELLVEQALDYISAEQAVEVLDLGTGCGAIACAIARLRPLARVTAVDNSAAALAVARHNARSLGVELRLLASDWFDVLGDLRFDLVVANPPYVASADPALRAALRHEPATALDGGADGLEAIRRVLGGARGQLHPGGHLLVEHGAAQGPATRALALGLGFVDVLTRRDLAGRDRLLVATSP